MAPPIRANASNNFFAFFIFIVQADLATLPATSALLSPTPLMLNNLAKPGEGGSCWKGGGAKEKGCCCIRGNVGNVGRPWELSQGSQIWGHAGGDPQHVGAHANHKRA